MNTIKFNNHTFEVLSFNKSTYFNDGGFNSNASCQIKTSDITSLYALAEERITSLQIYADNELIYDVDNLNGQLNSIDEYLSGNRVDITVRFDFTAAPVNELAGE